MSLLSLEYTNGLKFTLFINEAIFCPFPSNLLLL